MMMMIVIKIMLMMIMIIIMIHNNEASKPTAISCMPRVQLPRVGWNVDSTHTCLFLGIEPEGLQLALPKPDLRVTLCLNRGDMNSAATIPVFSVENLSDEMDEVASAFLTQNVVMQENKDLWGQEVATCSFTRRHCADLSLFPHPRACLCSHKQYM